MNPDAQAKFVDFYIANDGRAPVIEKVVACNAADEEIKKLSGPIGKAQGYKAQRSCCIALLTAKHILDGTEFGEPTIASGDQADTWVKTLVQAIESRRSSPGWVKDLRAFLGSVKIGWFLKGKRERKLGCAEIAHVKYLPTNLPINQLRLFKVKATGEAELIRCGWLQFAQELENGYWEDRIAIGSSQHEATMPAVNTEPASAVAHETPPADKQPSIDPSESGSNQTKTIEFRIVVRITLSVLFVGLIVALLFNLWRPTPTPTFTPKQIGREGLERVNTFSQRVPSYEDQFAGTIRLTMGWTNIPPIEIHMRGTFTLVKEDRQLNAELVTDQPRLPKATNLVEALRIILSGRLLSGDRVTNTFSLFSQSNVVTICHHESQEHAAYTNYSLDLLDTNQVKDLSRQIVGFAFRWYPFLLTTNANAIFARLSGSFDTLETNGMMQLAWNERILAAEAGGGNTDSTSDYAVHITASATPDGKIVKTVSDLTSLCHFLGTNPRLNDKFLYQLILTNVTSAISIVEHTNAHVQLTVPNEFFAPRPCGRLVEKFRNINW